MQKTAERQQKRQKRKADEGQLQAKRNELDKAKVRRVAVLALVHDSQPPRSQMQ